ncbi:hypothetical protein [Ancylobacter terrae]|uniref:hypothetical protein n=1 Tax=Ancylobacter sp. sgz301288 TaxID=3342077 RepID=UPI00385D45FE
MSPAPARSPAALADTPSLQASRLGEADLDAIEALHHLSMGADIRPDIVKPEKRSFFAGILGGRGGAFGLFDGGTMVAYAILQHAILPDDDPRPLLGLSAQPSLAKLAGAGVAPSHRGQGLQRRLIHLRVEAAGDADLLFSTAAPLNTPSWTNLIAEGFAIRAIVTRYGGLVRFLLVRERGAGPVPAALVAAGRALAPLDLDGQRAVLAAGWRGAGLARIAGEPAILYVPPAAR